MSQHPAFKTEEEIKALRAADPAAFDDEPDTVAETDEAKEARERDENGRFKAKHEAGADVEKAGEDASKVEEAKADEAKPDDAKADDDKPKVNMVPQPRVDELAAERNREREGRLAAERRVAELEAAQAAANTKDYDGEIAALNLKYDEGDVDFTEYQKQMTALVVDKTRAEVLADVAKKDTEKAQQTVQQQYDAARARFFENEEHKALVGSRARDAAFAAAIDEVFEGGAAKSYDEVFALAAEIVKRDFPSAKVDPVDPHAQRRAADAAAASKASQTPPAINGGTSNRSTVENVVDLKTLKPGKFSKNLSAADQEKLLGAGAL